MRLPLYLFIAFFSNLSFFSAVTVKAGALQHGPTEFFFGILRNYQGQASYVRVMISSSSTELANVSVETSETVIFSGTVTSGAPVNVDVRPEWRVQSSGSADRRKGIIVSASSSAVNVVVANVYKIGSSSGTSGAYHIVPSLNLTLEQYEYYVMSINSKPGSTGRGSEMLLVGNVDNTTITIYPSHSLTLPRDPQLSDEESNTLVVERGQGHTVTLHRLQTLLVIKSSADLTGTRIVSDRPLSVLSGHECGNVPSNLESCDHVGVNVPPTTTWGREFMLLPFLGKPSGQRYKILSAVNGTVIHRACSGNVEETIHLSTAGKSYEFNTNAYTSCHLLSNHAILVVQLSQGYELDGVGDPSMMPIAPITQYVSEASFVSLSRDDFPNSFISITTTPDYFHPNNILLNGQPVKASWSAIFSSNGTTVGWGCRLRIPQERQGHVVQHRNGNGRLSVLVYGFNSQPRHAFGYLARLSFPPLQIEPVVNLAVRASTSVVEGGVFAIEILRTIVTHTITHVQLTAEPLSSNTSTATDIDDYVLRDNEVIFLPGETSKVVTIATRDDNITENSEMLLVMLTGSHVIPGEDIEARLIIMDNDDVVVGFRGTPQLIQGEVNVTVAITSGQLQEGVELGVVVDNSYLLPNGITGSSVTANSVSENQPRQRQLLLSSDATQHTLMFNVSEFILQQDTMNSGTRFILVSLSSSSTPNSKSFTLADNSPLLINLNELQIERSISVHPSTSQMISNTPSHKALPTSSFPSFACPSVTREVSLVTLTVTSSCPTSSPIVPSYSTNTIHHSQTRRVRPTISSTSLPTKPSILCSTHPPSSSGAALDQLTITRMTFIAIVVTITLSVLVIILLVGGGICFLCNRRNQKAPQTMTNHS